MFSFSLLTWTSPLARSPNEARIELGASRRRRRLHRYLGRVRLHRPGVVAMSEKLDLVLSRLEDVRQTSKGFSARCPIHGGRSHGDLTVNVGERWIMVDCFAGCDWGKVIRALDLEPKDLVLDEGAPYRKRPVRQRELELTTEACCLSLRNEPEVLRRLRFGRGWAAQALELLGVGWDGSRLTLPVRNAEGKLHDVLRYDPFGEGRTKILAGQGKSRLPFPAPEGIDTHVLFLVEGEGTAISMLSIGLWAVSLPGSLKGSRNVSRPGAWRGAGWHKSWARRFGGFRQLILLPDCDGPGRVLMGAARYDLEKAGVKVSLVDLGPKTWDGSDVADMLLSKTYDGPSRRMAKDVLREIVAEKAEVLVAA